MGGTNTGGQIGVPGFANPSPATSVNWADFLSVNSRQNSVFVPIDYSGNQSTTNLSLLSVVPRGGYDDNGNEIQTLELWYNPFPITGDPQFPAAGTISPPSIYQLAYNTVDGYGITRRTRFARIEAVESATPVLFWATQSDDGGPTLYCLLLGTVAETNKLSPPNVADITTFSVDQISGTGAIIDFTSAVLNSTIYLVWSNLADSTIWWNRCKGAQSELAPMSPAAQSEALWSIPDGMTLLSLDACVAYYNAADTKGQLNPPTTPVIAIAALYHDDNANRLLDVRLVDPNVDAGSAGFVTQVFSGQPNFADQNCGIAVRIVWGQPYMVVPTAQFMNGLTVAIADNAQRSGPYSYLQTGAIHGASIDLTAENFGNFTNFDLVQPGPGYLDKIDGLVVKPNSLDLSPMMFPSFDPNNPGSASYNMLWSGLVDAWTGDPTLILGNALAFFVGVTMSMSLTAKTGTARSTASNLPQLSVDDLNAAISSWQLLGVVTAPPPFDPTTSSPVSEVDVTYSAGESSDDGTTTTKSLTAGLNLASAKANVTQVYSRGTDDAVSSTLTNSYKIALDYSDPSVGGLGWFLFYQPEYMVETYTAAIKGGIATKISFQNIMVAAGSGSFSSSPFKLQDPSTPYNSDDNVQVALAANWGTTNWPSITSPQDWTEDYNGQTWMLQDIPGYSFQGLKVGGPQQSETLNDTATVKVSLTSSIKIDASDNCEVMKKVFSFSIGGSADMSVSNTMTSNSSFTLTVTSTYSDITTSSPTWMLRPVFRQASGQGAPWVPNVLRAQQPWLLTWTVDDYVSETGSMGAKS